MTKYKSVNDLINTINENIFKLNSLNIGLIVGIPRSGMIPATYISLLLNKPLTDINGFINNTTFGSGNRFKNLEIENKNILIIDDSISSGQSMIEVKQKLKNIKGYNIKYLAIYAREQSKNMVDLYFEKVEGDRIFQWNLFHHRYILSKSCMDIDGVLCRDPKPEENDDGEKYKNFLLNAEPKFVPQVKIKTLITCRLEKYRKETVEWLSKHNIEYDNLIMLDLPDKQSRIKWGKYGEYKAKEYSKQEYVFFIESSLKEARKIKEITGKTIFCTEIMDII